MASTESHLRLQFLKESANFLKSQSPSTSAHLIFVHNHILREGTTPVSPSLQESFCGACGSARASRQADDPAENTINNELLRKSQPLTAKGGSIYECPRCHRRIFRAVRKQKPLQKGQPTTSVKKATPLTRPLLQSQNEGIPNPHPQEASANSDTKSSGNTSSKKRAKARKQQGLQALLTAGKQTSQTSSSNSLNLLDFLQQ